MWRCWYQTTGTLYASTLLSALILVTHCSSGHVITRETECGTFTGTVDEYQAYLQACATERFSQTIAAQRAASIAAAEEITGTAAQRRRVAMRENLQRLGAALADALNRTPSTRRIAAPSPRCEASPSTCDAMSAHVEAVLIRSGHTTILDRAHTDAVMAELRFSLSNKVNEETAARLGRFLGATHVLVLVIGRTDTADVFLVTARVIDVERTTTIAVASERCVLP